MGHQGGRNVTKKKGGGVNSPRSEKYVKRAQTKDKLDAFY